ncbi:MCE family protein [Streptosporangiaceae bacterium NEAU-GS5]|nr:MCE family protein [Streptosporangiaceae bacterium NEAU-GS5]
MRRRLVGFVVLLTLVAAVVVLIHQVTKTAGTRLTAVFGHAGQGLDTLSPVKIRGITIGGVSSVTLNGQGRAVLDLHVDPEVKIPDTVVAAIEPASVFGPKFVNLIPGAHESTGPFLSDGAQITRTEDPRDLSDSLGAAYRAVNAVDPEEVAIIVHTLGRGLDGKGDELGGIIDDTSTLVGVAKRHQADATQFLRDTAALSTSLKDKGGDIVGIADDVDNTLPQLQARADAVRVLLQEFGSISDLAAHGLRKHAGDLRTGVTSGERAVGIIYRQLGVAGTAVRGLTSIVDQLNDLIKAPGPDGNQLLDTQAFLITDLCQTFVGVCR